MKRISQRYSSDCFPTCVAIVSGLSHKKALKLVHPRAKQRRNPVNGRKVYYGSNFVHKITALAKLNYRIKYHGKKPRSFNRFKNPTFIQIKWKTRTKHCHAIVWDPKTKKIYDPGYKKALPYKLYRKNFQYALEVRPQN